ncbi:Eco57I restriction-modification methylase domain-containing protein [Runella sp.]|uniref:Eco57I restriction-modification methylase domain-containing protein n=1 Tax=Runella sp. TaxID=1960881 RepID=UPI003D13B3F6
MDKKILQRVLSSAYNQSAWRQVLTDVFGVKRILQVSQPIVLPTNELVVTAYEIGSFDTADDRTVGIFEVQLLPNVKLERNRVGLRELLRKIISDQIDAALIVFVPQHQLAKWRFSFVSDIRILNPNTEEIERKTTDRKRYTYLLGEGESCRTAAGRFMTLQNKPFTLQDLYDAFNVEKLTKEFFEGYKKRYEILWHFIRENPKYREVLIDKEQESESKEEKPIRDFSKKLLGRIVFLYFLQKKGWLGVPAESLDWKDGDPDFIKNFFLNSTDKTRFYSLGLVELFFRTLNQIRENDIFKLTGTKVPYLNGGLFDNDAPQTDYFDFPESYFQDLFDFFDQYNFTIDENNPDEAEVGIDPEMLGHIFENLLEENREKGTFYTPKEIVQYMCQEALLQYLKPQFPEEADIERFVRDKELSLYLKGRENAQKLNVALDKIRICDPAIGSGAFPIGVLQEIFQAKRFIFPYINVNTFDAAEIKLRIIENSIYGIDLDKGAVDIARLRFWLALVVDEDTPRPLPNLDYKIMQGDSLFDTFEGVDLSKIGTDDDDEVVLEEKNQLELFGGAKQTLLVFDKAARGDLTKLIHDYFDPKKNSLTKAAIRRKIDEKINKKIHTSFEREKLDLKVKIQKQEKLWKDQGIWGKLNEKSKEYKNYKLLLELFESFDQREQRLLELQKKPNEKPYFLWRLYFKEVFEQGGFDIVIGNPPYFSVSKQTQLKPLAGKYKTFEATGDIYSLFYERGHQLLRPGGVLVYITGSSWLRSSYGMSLRKFFREQTNPIKLIDLSDCQIFESATVRTTIMAYRKAKNNNQLQALRLTRKMQYAVKQLHPYFLKNHIQLTSQPDNAWVILDRVHYDLKQHIEAQGKRIKEWEIVINRGVLTGFNDAFVIGSKAKKNAILERDETSKNIIKPLLRGRDVERYSFEFKEQWLIGTFPTLKLDIEKFPAVKEHLLDFGKQRLEQIGELGSRKKTGNKWFETQDNIAYWYEFEKPKIIYPNIVKDISFSYDDKGFYLNDKCFIMTGEKLKYLLGVLNSKLFRFAFEENFPELQGNAREVKSFVMNEIPIKFPSQREEKNIAIIADYLLYLYHSESPRVNLYADNNQVASFFEDIINHLVCELYFGEEMKERNVAMNSILEIIPIESLSQTEQQQIIEQVYKKLQTPGSSVRKCIAMVNIKLPETVGQILSRTV